MRPRQCVNGITLWGKAKDTATKISIMQNQFPCISLNTFIAAITGMIVQVGLLGEWQPKKTELFCNAQYQLVDKVFKIHKGVFVYVFLASSILDFDFTAQSFSLRQAPNLCMDDIKWNFVIISYSVLWQNFDDIEKYFHDFKLISNSTATNSMGWTHINFAAARSHTSYRFIITYWESIFHFFLFYYPQTISMQCAQYYFQLKSNFLR